MDSYIYFLQKWFTFIVKFTILPFVSMSDATFIYVFFVEAVLKNAFDNIILTWMICMCIKVKKLTNQSYLSLSKVHNFTYACYY